MNGKRSRLDIATIATIHEFSRGKRIPRRPLWNPTIKEMGSSKGIQKICYNITNIPSKESWNTQ
jgi:hypothetical protein